MSVKTYRSKDGKHYFTFRFIEKINEVVIYCDKHPDHNGKDSNPRKTHLFRSGKICFIEGKEPKTKSRAEILAKQWAEYFLEYRKTGCAQS